MSKKETPDFKTEEEEAPRKITEEEARDEFLSHVRAMARYWERAPEQTEREKLEGFAFSIMVALDGGAGGLPGYHVIPVGNEEGKKFSIEEGENYYPPTDGLFEGENENVIDIAGSLHELLFRKN